MITVKNGLYLLKEEYFEKFDNGNMMDSQTKQRPHYYAMKIDGVVWMVPISTRVEKYKGLIERYEKSKKSPCTYYHIGLIGGRERAFLIGNMIPTVEEYVLRQYGISGIPYIVRDEDLIRKLESKAKRYILLVRQGILHPAVDILKIEKELKTTD